MKIWLLLLAFLATITVLSACNNRSGDSLQVVSTLTNTPWPDPVIATSTPLPPKVNSSSQKLITPTQSHESSVPTGDNTVQSQSDLERCGLILPLTSLPSEPANIRYDIDVPADMLPVEALPALERLISAPETVALVAFEIGRENYKNGAKKTSILNLIRLLFGKNIEN